MNKKFCEKCGSKMLVLEAKGEISSISRYDDEIYRYTDKFDSDTGKKLVLLLLQLHLLLNQRSQIISFCIFFPPF